MTTATAKTIQIYLPMGEPRGIHVADRNTKAKDSRFKKVDRGLFALNG